MILAQILDVFLSPMVLSVDLVVLFSGLKRRAWIRRCARLPGTTRSTGTSSTPRDIWWRIRGEDSGLGHCCLRSKGLEAGSGRVQILMCQSFADICALLLLFWKLENPKVCSFDTGFTLLTSP